MARMRFNIATGLIVFLLYSSTMAYAGTGFPQCNTGKPYKSTIKLGRNPHIICPLLGTILHRL